MSTKLQAGETFCGALSCILEVKVGVLQCWTGSCWSGRCCSGRCVTSTASSSQSQSQKSPPPPTTSPTLPTRLFDKKQEKNESYLCFFCKSYRQLFGLARAGSWQRPHTWSPRPPPAGGERCCNKNKKTKLK